MKSFNYPKRVAFILGTKMKQFRARTEDHAYSEVNPYAEEHRVEVVRQIDWEAFDKVIKQLQFLHNQTIKPKAKTILNKKN